MKLDNGNIESNIWILIYTKAREERKAYENLKKQGFETFLPLIAPTNKNINSASLVPVFPRYLFVKINTDLENWNSIKYSIGVSKIVMFSDKFTSISEDIVNSIKERLNQSGIYKENISVVDHKEGDTVSISEGSFAGIDAIFLSQKSKDRVRLLLKLLNTSVIAEVDKSDLSPKEVIRNFKF